MNKGADVRFASPGVASNLPDGLLGISLPSYFSWSLYSFSGVKGYLHLKRHLASIDEILGDWRPELILAYEESILPFAYLLAGHYRTDVALLSLGGRGLRPELNQGLGDWFNTFFRFYLPLFGKVSAHLSVEDSTQLHRGTPVFSLPSRSRLHIPVPWRNWTRRSREEAEKVIGLEGTKRIRIIWASRSAFFKRPWVFFNLIKAFLTWSSEYEFVVVTNHIEQQKKKFDDCCEGLNVKWFDMFDNTEGYEAAFQASDLAIFPAAGSVTGLMFKECVANGIPAACTVAPEDIILHTLFEKNKDFLEIDETDFTESAERIRKAVSDKSHLKMAERASERIRKTQPSQDEFGGVCSDFLINLVGR